jgi:hypothetical protein
MKLFDMENTYIVLVYIFLITSCAAVFILAAEGNSKVKVKHWHYFWKPFVFLFFAIDEHLFNVYTLSRR